MKYAPNGQRVAVLDKYRNTLAHDECYWTGTITSYLEHDKTYLVVFDNGDEDWYRSDEIQPAES